MILPPDEDAAVPLNPGKEALDEPASGVSAEAATILRLGFASVRTVRRDHLDAIPAQFLIQRIAIVGAISNQIFIRPASFSHTPRRSW